MATNIKELINSLRLTVDLLIEKQLIPAGRFEYMFKGDNEFLCIPEDGLTLVFEDKSRLLISVSMTLIASGPKMKIYRGDIPPPFFPAMDKAKVRAILGEPSEAKEAVKLPIIGMVGGWDTYINQIKELYPNTRIIFAYSADQRVSNLTFKRI
ncbi:pyocin immunity protein [Photorhabdus thracensis]|nr:pyocin immunity protein [Photorhabdus thracensis]